MAIEKTDIKTISQKKKNLKSDLFGSDTDSDSYADTKDIEKKNEKLYNYNSNKFEKELIWLSDKEEIEEYIQNYIKHYLKNKEKKKKFSVKMVRENLEKKFNIKFDSKIKNELKKFVNIKYNELK